MKMTLQVGWSDMFAAYCRSLTSFFVRFISYYIISYHRGCTCIACSIFAHISTYDNGEVPKYSAAAAGAVRAIVEHAPSLFSLESTGMVVLSEVNILCGILHVCML